MNVKKTRLVLIICKTSDVMSLIIAETAIQPP